jgi:hypothetical protein
MATDFFKIGQATGQQFVDVTGAVQKGLEMGLKPFAEYEKSRKERVAALGRILQSTPNLEELPKIPAQYSPEISDWASNAKNEYADAARTLVQTSADSPEYREAVQKMNNIKTAFVNLDNQLNGIREERIEYLDDYKNGMVSKGFKNSNIEAAYGQTGKIAGIDANGNVSMSGAGGQAFKWDERQEHYNVNPYIQKSMVGISTNAKNNGLKGISFTQDEYKEQLKAIMSDPKIGNIQGLKSLVYDDIDGTPLNITQTNPEILQLLEAETPDLPLIKQKLVDILAPALENVNNTSISKYNDALKTPNGTITKYDKELSVIKNNYESQKNNIEPILKSFLNSDKTTDDALQSFGRLGLNVTGEVQDADGNVIGIKVKNSEVGEEITVSYSDPASALISTHNALGASKIGVQPSLSDEFLTAETKESEIEQANMLLATANSVPETEIPTRIIQTGIFKGRTGLKKAQAEAQTQRQIEINSIMQARKRYNELANKLGLQKIEFPDIK